MKNEPEPLWMKCTVTAPPEGLEVAGELLLDAGAGGTELTDGAVAAYFTPEDVALVEERLRGLERILEGGLSFSWQPVESEDWWESWKKYFHPFRASPRLWVSPTWERAGTVDEGAVEVLVDPGRAFGTGAHETTRLCLELLDECLKAQPVDTLLDAGCGSGILTAAALKIGARRALAFDIDPQAAAAARENAALNGVADRVDAVCSDIRAIKGRFPLVVANILYQIIMGMAPALADHTAPGGRLIISGLLTQELDGAEAMFNGLGLATAARRTMGQWGALLFSREEVTGATD